MKNLLFWILITGFLQTANAQTEGARKQHFNVDKNGLAIKGYDPVAYILQKKAVKGEKQYSAVYMGILYYFGSSNNLSLFKKDPAKYEPAYGGWCAYAMGNTSEKVEIDPETFKVINGKTYLFYNFYFNNTLKSWNKDEPKLNATAEINWLKIINSK
jgi:YHS domain-containing protein